MKYFVIFLILTSFTVFMPHAFGSCVSLPCNDANIKLGESNYRFIDFSYQNKVGDPITFILEKTAQDQCNSYVATITNEKDETVWEQNEASFCVISTNQNLTTSQIKLGYDPDNKIIMSESAKYLLKVQIDGGSIQREFVARHTTSSLSLDRVVYPVTWTFSPLKQFSSGVPFDEIYCRHNLMLVQKYDGTPACVTYETKEKLIERGWATTYPDTYDTKTVFEIVKDEKIFDVEYKIKGGSVEDMVYDKDGNTLLTTIDSSGEGKFTVVIPRDLLDAKMDYCPPLKANPPDDRFFVLLDGIEIPYDEILTTSEKRTLQIPFTDDAILEIIGACLI